MTEPVKARKRTINLVARSFQVPIDTLSLLDDLVVDGVVESRSEAMRVGLQMYMDTMEADIARLKREHMQATLAAHEETRRQMEADLAAMNAELGDEDENETD